jgi:hypothetical protein
MPFWPTPNQTSVLLLQGVFSTKCLRTLALCFNFWRLRAAAVFIIKNMAHLRKTLAITDASNTKDTMVFKWHSTSSMSCVPVYNSVTKPMTTFQKNASNRRAFKLPSRKTVRNVTTFQRNLTYMKVKRGNKGNAAYSLWVIYTLQQLCHMQISPGSVYIKWWKIFNLKNSNYFYKSNYFNFVNIQIICIF